MWNSEFPYGMNGYSDHSRRPYYNDETDYNTNAPSYYDDLARKQKLIQYLAEKIGEYDKELEKRFREWDKNLEEFPANVEKLLIRWLKDGTLEEIINHNIFRDMNIDIDTVKKSIVELKEKDIDLSKDIAGVKSMIAASEREMNKRIDTGLSPNPFYIAETLEELQREYPNGHEGVAVVKADGYYYYYRNSAWTKGNLYISPVSYSFVDMKGNPKNLNLEESWKRDADIVKLDTGYYIAYLQDTLKDENYPIAKNIPKIDGLMCLIKVIKYGVDKRTDYEIIENYTNKVWTASLNFEGVLSEWSEILKNKESRALQQYRLTYYNGDILSLERVNKLNIENRLSIPVTDLPTGFFFGQIQDNNGVLDRKLPDDIIYNNFYTFIIYKTYDGRQNITLHDNTTKTTWQSFSRPESNDMQWYRVRYDEERTKLNTEYVLRCLKEKDDNYKALIITDTHIQNQANTMQIGLVNQRNMNDFEDISKMYSKSDIECHLGDWVDGNHKKEETTLTSVQVAGEFLSKTKRHGIYGNHDFNGQWDGFAGNNALYSRNLNRIYSKEEMKAIYTKYNKDYYYTDDTNKKIRNIFLNSFDISYMTDSDGFLLSDPLHQSAFGSEQVKWLLETLKSVPQDYNVIVYTHDALNSVFSDNNSYYNGDTVRKIFEHYQMKTSEKLIASGISEGNPEYSYFKLDITADMTNTKGKILAIVNGHRHEDKSIFKNGIRYISLLCARADGKGTIESPERDYFGDTRNAISLLSFDTVKNTVKVVRYGAGKDNTYNLFK